jgi:hypothetical protein
MCPLPQETPLKQENSSIMHTPLRNQATPKRKRTFDSPPDTPTPKTPRLQYLRKNRTKIEEKQPISPPKVKKTSNSKKKNPHPHMNQQEFVKIGQILTLLKHGGLATSSRRKFFSKKKKENPPPKTKIIVQTQTQEIKLEMPQISKKRRKSENFSAILEFFNTQKTPPNSKLQVGKENQEKIEKIDNKRPVKMDLKIDLKIDDELMPRESSTNRKSNTPNSPPLKSFAVGKMKNAELNPPPASTSARPELSAEKFKNFKIFGGKKPANRPANHISERKITLAETDVIGQR